MACQLTWEMILWARSTVASTFRSRTLSGIFFRRCLGFDLGASRLVSRGLIEPKDEAKMILRVPLVATGTVVLFPHSSKLPTIERQTRTRVPRFIPAPFAYPARDAPVLDITSFREGQ